jgi:phosphoserine phosphatase
MSATIFEALDGEVLDIEQVTIKDRLIQAVLLGLGPQDDVAALSAAMERTAAELGLALQLIPGPAEVGGQRRRRARVTIMASPLCPADIAAFTRRVAESGGNIERIGRVARYPVTAISLEVSGADTQHLRRSLAVEAAVREVDAAVQPLGLDARGQHLVVLDVDSTLIRDEVIELIAEHAGCAAEVAQVTASAMAGEIDFAASLTRRVALLEGVPAAALEEVRQRVRLTPGARTLCRTLRHLGYRIALVSGGFAEIVEPLGRELGVDAVRANRLEVVDGRLTGRVVGDVVDRPGKATALREFAAEMSIPLSRTIAIGDGANDLDMLAAAGLGVAFNAKPVVRAEADTAVNVPYLDTVLFLLGITREEIEDADTAARDDRN